MVSWAHILNQRHMNFQNNTLKTKIYSQNLLQLVAWLWGIPEVRNRKQTESGLVTIAKRLSSSYLVILLLLFGQLASWRNVICEMKKSSRLWRFWMTKQGEENDQIGGGDHFFRGSFARLTYQVRRGTCLWQDITKWIICFCLLVISRIYYTQRLLSARNISLQEKILRTMRKRRSWWTRYADIENI